MTTNETNVLIMSIIVIPIFILLARWRWRYDTAKENQIKETARKIKSDYENALKGTDKTEALRLGREYYGSLREDGRATTYDEQAINNDLNSMNVAVQTTQIVSKEEPRLSNSTTNQKKLYCSNCGKEYIKNENKKFCEECGNRY